MMHRISIPGDLWSGSQLGYPVISARERRSMRARAHTHARRNLVNSQFGGFAMLVLGINIGGLSFVFLHQRDGNRLFQPKPSGGLDKDEPVRGSSACAQRPLLSSPHYLKPPLLLEGERDI
jgi:hypothetical protein